MHFKARVLVVVLLALSVVGLDVGSAQVATAVTGSQFKAGYIISDQVFYNSSTMTVQQVQSFLASQESGCGNTTPACLQNYTTATPNIAPDSTAGLCNGYAASASSTAAAIIVGAAVSCGVNPQSLLALIQKESGLVTDTTPSQSQYNSATGAFCPDNAAGCNPQYQGFFTQVYYAARQFKLYRLYPNNYNFVAGRYNQIQYNPSTSCGSSAVYIQNQATAGLYDYTPYQPNAAALANLYGTGDSCSAYGNRNFWVLFNNWFGSTGSGNYPLAAGSSPAGTAVSGGYQYAVRGASGTLTLSGPLGNGDLGLGIQSGTSPTIAAVRGGVQVAFQAAGGILWTIGALGNVNTGLAVAPGTSPSIIAINGGYEIVYQGADSALHFYGSIANANTGLGMAAGSSPSIAAVSGGYEVAFQADTQHMWLVGSLGNTDTGLGLAPRSSPSITAAGSGFQAAFQSNNGSLWVVGTLGNTNTGLPMATGSSPAVTVVSAGYVVAFAAADGTLTQIGALGTSRPGLGVLTGTSPTIGLYSGSARVAFQGGDGILWTFGSGGTGQVLATT